MSPGRASRLAALRHRLARHASPIAPPTMTEEPAEPLYEPRYGLPAPPAPLEMLPPIQVPPHVQHGVYRTCGKCEGYLTNEVRYCPVCPTPEELQPATQAPFVRDTDPTYHFPQPRRSDER